ncbi:hemerythrin domain-containing protein [Bordetella tumulicola]|uniref:hemerythrin domain-containing protein n=1 Tax=Bordetella tumulicola TaxID=1649133 RepID=UPI0039F1457D
MSETIYEALRASHETQRSLCRKLMRATPQSGRRGEVFRELRIELAAHAAAEERFLYAPILMDDMGLSPSRHALAEHHEIDECVEELSKVDEQGDAWSNHAKKLSHKVHHHLREEETKFFQTSGKILTEAQKTSLAKRYVKDFERMKRVLSEQ